MSETATALSEYDFIIVVDASGSMSTVDPGKTQSRWDSVKETAGVFTRDLDAIDSDGLGLVIFGGSNVTAVDGVKPETIDGVFNTRRPMGGTPLHLGLEAALKLAGKSDKKDFILVITDGVPDDKAAAAKVIIEASQKQETDDALTILFVQVGTDPSAAAYLKMLDDDLKGAKFDIVDCKTQAEAEAFPTMADLVVAAIND